MGFTAVDGLPMGTRTGQLDPGVVLYLLQAKGFDAGQVERFLYHDGGLKGLSGISNDVRDLLASDAPGAARALDYLSTGSPARPVRWRPRWAGSTASCTGRHRASAVRRYEGGSWSVPLVAEPRPAATSGTGR